LAITVVSEIEAGQGFFEDTVAGRTAGANALVIGAQQGAARGGRVDVIGGETVRVR
jgi:hypothetical protein